MLNKLPTVPKRMLVTTATGTQGAHPYKIVSLEEKQFDEEQRYRRRQTVTEELIPTQIHKEMAKPPIELEEGRRNSRFPLLRVVKLFVGYRITNIRYKISGRYTAKDSAVRLREVFENLGGLWIKAGQLVAMRNDLLPDIVCKELARLQNRAVGFPYEKVQASFRSDMGKEIEDVFEWFDPQPFAAASVSQVHFAKLPKVANKVCVKILRPDGNEAFQRDLAIISKTIGFFSFFGLGKYLHLHEALYELEQMVREELDFRYEAANMLRMRKSLKSHSIFVPRVYEKHCGCHTLTTEHIRGVLMTDFIELGKSDPKALKNWCAVNNVKPKKVATKLFQSAMRQLFEDNLFHADLHPGNIFLLKDSKLVLIDFGTIGTSGATFLSNYRASLRALSQQDFVKATDLSLMMTITPPSIERIAPLRKDLIRLYREWDARTHLSGIPYHERSMASAGGDSGKVMAKHKVQLSWEFMRISRTWATLDASISHLCPDANYMKFFRDYFENATRRKRRLAYIVPKTMEIARDTITTMGEYEALLSPALRSRMIYTASAGHISERLALSFVSLLRVLRWGVVVTLCVLGLILFDAHGQGVAWVEENVFDDFRTIASEVGKLGMVFGIVGLIGVSFALRRIINRLTSTF